MQEYREIKRILIEHSRYSVTSCVYSFDAKMKVLPASQKEMYKHEHDIDTNSFFHSCHSEIWNNFRNLNQIHPIT